MYCRILKKEEITIERPESVYDISVEKHHNFVLANGAVAHNCDTFQSANIMQNLKADGFNTEIVSVDRVDSSTRSCLPYAFFKSAIYERHLQLYRDGCELLTDEIVSLERLSDGHVDHPQNFSKDISDACCGATWLASKYAEEYSYDYGENLDASLDINVAAPDDFKKQQMIAEFQEELAKIYTDIHIASETIDYQKKQEYEMYMDISQGIIIL